MGPFFAASNIGSSTSAGEVEALVNSLTTPQRDGIADIVYEAYGRSIYEYFLVPTGHWNQDAAIADGEGSTFLDLTAPLAYAATGFMSSSQYAYFNQLSAVVSAHEADLGGSAKQGDAGSSGESAERYGVAWPNPATDAVRLRVPADAAGVVRVFDMAGRLVATVPFAESSTAQTIEWTLRANSGGRVAPGIYRLVVPTHEGARIGSSVVVL